MEKYYRQTIGINVETHTGIVLTRIRDVIMNVEKGKVVGFLVTSGPQKAISPMDIIKWSRSIIIHDTNDIIDVDDVIHIQNALEKNIKIYQKKVMTKDEEYVGKVIDFGIDNRFFELTCLVVAKTFLGIFFWDKRLISSKDIIEIKKDKIVVKNLVKPVKMKKLQVDLATS